MSNLFAFEDPNATAVVITVVCDAKYYSSAVFLGQQFAKKTTTSVFEPILAKSEGQVIDEIKLRCKGLESNVNVIFYVAGLYDESSQCISTTDQQDFCAPSRMVSIFGNFKHVKAVFCFFEVDDAYGDTLYRLTDHIALQSYQVIGLCPKENSLFVDNCSFGVKSLTKHICEQNKYFSSFSADFSYDLREASSAKMNRGNLSCNMLFHLKH